MRNLQTLRPCVPAGSLGRRAAWSAARTALLLLVAGVPFARAQQTLWEKAGGSDGAALGAYSATIGDVDGDGVHDLLLSRTDHDASGRTERVAVVSGADGSDVDLLSEPHRDSHFGWAFAALEDVDGDGVDDFAIGAPAADFGGVAAAGVVFVHSGRDRALLWSLGGEATDVRFAASLALGADVDGDGLRDLVIGCPNWLPIDGIGADHETGKVFLVSAANGALLREWKGEHKNDHFGERCADARDLDGDTVPDLLVAALFDRSTRVGKVYAYSGANGALLYEATGEFANQSFGWSLVGLGDVDGDGLGDVAIGAPEGSGLGAGRVFVLSGPQGERIAEIEGERFGDFFGVALAAVGDSSRDGVPDFLVGALGSDHSGFGEAGRASLYSGATLRLLRTFDDSAPKYAEHFGTTLRELGDVQGDGIADFAIGSPNADRSHPEEGVLHAFAGDDLYLQANSESVTVGDPLELWTRGGPPGALHLLVVVAVDGVPLWFVVRRDHLDDFGESSFATTVPGGLDGRTVQLLSLAAKPGSAPISSDVVTIAFE